MIQTQCTHKDQIHEVVAKDSMVCEDCIITGDTWLGLRMCLHCGHVGCCDGSKNKHATKHFKDTGHAIIKSLSSSREFTWCYVDELYL